MADEEKPKREHMAQSKFERPTTRRYLVVGRFCPLCKRPLKELEAKQAERQDGLCYSCWWAHGPYAHFSPCCDD